MIYNDLWSFMMINNNDNLRLLMITYHDFVWFMMIYDYLNYLSFFLIIYHDFW